MKIIKKAAAVALTGVIILAAKGAALAEETSTAKFGFVSGKITEIVEYKNTGFEEMDGQKLILVTGEDGQLMNFLITKDTYFANDENLEIGKNAIGYYKNNTPAIMIYPPQMPAVVFGVLPENGPEIKVDFFDENLLSADNSLKLNVGSNTEILQTDGAKYSGDIKNKNLVVFYTVTTRSIPPQTSPTKVIVLSEGENPFAPEASNEGGIIVIGPQGQVIQPENNSGAANSANLEGILIIVNGKKLDKEQAFEKTEVMVPFRGVAEALGFDVGWDSVNKAVLLNNSKVFTIGSMVYYNNEQGKVTKKTLKTAPELINNKTYVPFSFFSEVINISKAEFSNNQILLNN